MNVLMVGHSYVVTLNRRLCREVALAGGDSIRVVVAAPGFYWGDLRPITLERVAGEPYELEAIPSRLSKVPQLFHYSRKLRTVLRREPWDIVHAWEEPYIVAGGQIAHHSRRDSTLIYSTLQNLSKRYPPPFNLIERHDLARASGWVANGQTIAEALQDRPGYRDRPMRVIPLGVDLDVFRPDPEARAQALAKLGWSEPGPPVVGYLGRFVPQKGLTLLTRALDRLDGRTWRALFVGGGPQEALLRDWAANHSDQVRISTGVPHDEVPAYLNAMDLLCAPSQTTPIWKEQLGRMLLEAMGCGVPILASDSGEIPHVLAEGAGLVVPEADELAWTAALAFLLDSPDRRRELRAQGHSRAHDVYAWPVIARQYLAFYRELREQSRPHEAPAPSPPAC